MSKSTTALIELRHYYQNVVAQSEYQAIQAKTQIEHIDALLLNGLLQSQEIPVLNSAMAPEILALAEADSTPAVSTLTPILAVPSEPKLAKAKDRKSKTTALEQKSRKNSLANRNRPSPAEVVTASVVTVPEVPATSIPSKPSKPKRTPRTSAPTQPAKTTLQSGSRGRSQVLPLPAEYEGLSKIDTVARVLEATPGKVMHIEAIIERLYGKLTGDVLKAEKVRMKDVMTRGVQRKLWSKAKGVPSSIVAGELSQSEPNAAKAPAKPSRQPKTSTQKDTPKQATTAQRRRRKSVN